MDLDTTRGKQRVQMPIVLFSLDNVMHASHVPVKPLNQTRVIRVPVRKIVVEAAKWQMLSTRSVVSYFVDS